MFSKTDVGGGADRKNELSASGRREPTSFYCAELEASVLGSGLQTGSRNESSRLETETRNQWVGIDRTVATGAVLEMEMGDRVLGIAGVADIANQLADSH